MEGQRNIEINFNDNTKTVNVMLSATEDNWNSLAKKVCEVFDIKEEQAPGLKLKYTDNEGDIVTLDSDAELRQAILDNTQPKFVISLTSQKDEQRRMAKEERLKRKEERMKSKQERLERKKLKLAMKQERKLRKEEGKEGESPATGAVLLSSDREKEHADRLARKQERLAHREERLKKKAERLASRMARRGEKGPIDDEACQKRREEKEQRRQERILKRQEKRKAHENSAEADAANAGGSPPKLSKEERRQLREEQKRLRCEARKESARKNDLPFHSLEETKAWPENATQLYLDGNNMMFLTSTLRNLTLKRASGGARKAESLLESVADAFVAAMGDRIKQAVLIFDHTSTEKTKTFPNGTTLRVCSARPKYPTSDDALIDWAKEIAAAKDLERAGERMLFVTSDRGLGVQLVQSGGVLIKPKQFLYFACQTVTGNNNVDAWLESLLA